MEKFVRVGDACLEMEKIMKKKKVLAVLMALTFMVSACGCADTGTDTGADTDTSSSLGELESSENVDVETSVNETEEIVEEELTADEEKIVDALKSCEGWESGMEVTECNDISYSLPDVDLHVQPTFGIADPGFSTLDWYCMMEITESGEEASYWMASFTDETVLLINYETLVAYIYGKLLKAGENYSLTTVMSVIDSYSGGGYYVTSSDHIDVAHINYAM
ncbi:MAG: hypothetical protein LUC50_07105 [Ruminococcus sp.]|nr:hypothetical protein [Ruminococcus sp.]